jgi:hypothetical protein
MTDIEVVCSHGDTERDPYTFGTFRLESAGGVRQVGARVGVVPWPKGSVIEGMDDGELVSGSPARAILPPKSRQTSLGKWRLKCADCGHDLERTPANFRADLERSVATHQPEHDIYLPLR